MPFRTFTNGEVLTDSLINDYLMEQAVATVTSGTRPSSPVEGQVIYETDTDKLMVYDGSSWRHTGAYGGEGVTFTPTLTAATSGPTMGNSTTLGRYWRNGPNRVDVYMRIRLGSTWAAGTGAYHVNLPVNLNASAPQSHLEMSLYDLSGTAYYHGYVFAGHTNAGADDVSVGRLLLDRGSASGFTESVTNALPVVPANGDVFTISGTYWAVTG